MNDELESIWKEAVVWFKCYLRISLEELKKTTKTSVKIAGVSAEKSSLPTPNTGLERYCYINLLGQVSSLGE